jgi:hypothetical protein
MSMASSDETRPDPSPVRRDDTQGNVDDSLNAIERRIVRSIGDALARLRARMDAAEAYAAARDAEPQRLSARERAERAWRMMH